MVVFEAEFRVLWFAVVIWVCFCRFRERVFFMREWLREEGSVGFEVIFWEEGWTGCFEEFGCVVLYLFFLFCGFIKWVRVYKMGTIIRVILFILGIKE